MNSNNHKTPFSLIFVGGMIGAVVFLLLLGTSSLRVQNIDWLLHDDSGAHYLAWSFFRLEPWSFPLGKMNFYGAEMASNVVFADAIPLVSIPLKVFSAILPVDFQFFGWWALACFMLQGMVAVWLLGKFTCRTELLLIGAAFFAMQITVLYRFGWQFALMAQWVIPMGFGLLFCTPNRRIWCAWIALLVCAAAIHAYLEAILLALFGMWVAREAILRFVEKSPIQACLLIVYASGIGAVVLAFMASLGYFRPMLLQWGSAKGFGATANLLGGIFPTLTEGLLLPPHEVAFNLQWEGIWYLGAGALFLIICAIVAWVLRWGAVGDSFKPLGHKWPVLVWSSFYISLLFFMILSTGFIITLGPYVFVDVPLPKMIEKSIDIFRYVGRFIWPVATGLLFLGLLGTCLLPRAFAAIILFICLGLQYADVSLFAKKVLQPKQERSGMTKPLLDSRWDEIIAHRKGISVIPHPYNRFLGKEYDLALLAYKHKTKIDAAYYARYPSDTLEPMWQRFHDFWRGRPNPQWIYVVQEDLLKRKNLHAWKTLLPLEPRLLAMDRYFVASFSPSHQKMNEPVEWPIASLSADWEILPPGTYSFMNMDQIFDAVFLGGFEQNPQGALLRHDLGMMAFRIPMGVGFLELKFVPANPSNNRLFRVRGELLSNGKVIAEQNFQPEKGWNEFCLRFEDVSEGDYVLRLEVQFYHNKSGDWCPSNGRSLILTEAITPTMQIFR